MRWYFFSFARASSIDDFEMALIVFANVSHVVNSDSIRSLMTSGSRWCTSGIRRLAGSGMSLARVSILLAQIMCDSSSPVVVLPFTQLFLLQDVPLEEVALVIS